ncbi:YaeQ protein [gamma proteobacterium IMCC1989]|nr:YaeQ protein [gamma proteobacterium IMCC1989]
MALKPTIYKFTVMVSDFNRDYYEELPLTVAQHPSETLERMMVRVLAFCLSAQEGLSFTKGLSAPDEPDLWVNTLDDQLVSWIDVGEPAVDRIKKATRRAKDVSIYSFNSKSDSWWLKHQAEFARLNVSVYQFQWEQVQQLALLAERTLQASLTITDNTLNFSTSKGECDVVYRPLQNVKKA